MILDNNKDNDIEIVSNPIHDPTQSNKDSNNTIINTINYYQTSLSSLEYEEIRSIQIIKAVTRNNLKDVKDQSINEFIIIVAGAAFLSLNSGFINSICIIAHGQGVTHVTGSLTYFGINLASNNIIMSTNYLCIILCYMFGASITGYFTIDALPYALGMEYGPLFIIGGILLLIACIFEYSYDDNLSEKSYLYVFFCAMGSGLQNGITTKYSNNILRTTHMTGTATDIGIVIGRIIHAKYDEIWKLYFLLPSFIFYFIGGCIGAYVYQSLGKYSLTFSVVLFFFIGVLYMISVKKLLTNKNENNKYKNIQNKIEDN